MEENVMSQCKERIENYNKDPEPQLSKTKIALRKQKVEKCLMKKRTHVSEKQIGLNEHQIIGDPELASLSTSQVENIGAFLAGLQGDSAPLCILRTRQMICKMSEEQIEGHVSRNDVLRLLSIMLDCHNLDIIYETTYILKEVSLTETLSKAIMEDAKGLVVLYSKCSDTSIRRNLLYIFGNLIISSTTADLKSLGLFDLLADQLKNIYINKDLVCYQLWVFNLFLEDLDIRDLTSMSPVIPNVMDLWVNHKSIELSSYVLKLIQIILVKDHKLYDIGIETTMVEDMLQRGLIEQLMSLYVDYLDPEILITVSKVIYLLLDYPATGPKLLKFNLCVKIDKILFKSLESGETDIRLLRSLFLCLNEVVILSKKERRSLVFSTNLIKETIKFIFKSFEYSIKESVVSMIHGLIKHGEDEILLEVIRVNWIEDLTVYVTTAVKYDSVLQTCLNCLERLIIFGEKFREDTGTNIVFDSVVKRLDHKVLEFIVLNCQNDRIENSAKRLLECFFKYGDEKGTMS